MQRLQIKETLKKYILNNYKEYILAGLLFIIGLFIGVFVINNCKEQQLNEITSYINNFIEKFKQIEITNKIELIMNSIKNNLVLTIIIWISGTTVIGIPIVLIAILARGIILGYTIAAFTCTLGATKGIIFCLLAIFVQNIILIPSILTLGVSSMKLYKSIIKDKRKENIKLEIMRHTIIGVIVFVILIASAIIENIISIPLLKSFIKYF